MDTTPRTGGPGPASLTWQALAATSGIRAAGRQYGYLIIRGSDGETRLTRWASKDGSVPQLAGELTSLFAGEVVINAISVADPDMGKLVAQAYENGRSIHGQPAWQHIGSRKPDFYGRQAPAPGSDG